jgi:hypothetical protein
MHGTVGADQLPYLPAPDLSSVILRTVHQRSLIHSAAQPSVDRIVELRSSSSVSINVGTDSDKSGMNSIPR